MHSSFWFTFRFFFGSNLEHTVHKSSNSIFFLSRHHAQGNWNPTVRITLVFLSVKSSAPALGGCHGFPHSNSCSCSALPGAAIPLLALPGTHVIQSRCFFTWDSRADLRHLTNQEQPSGGSQRLQLVPQSYTWGAVKPHSHPPGPRGHVRSVCCCPSQSRARKGKWGKGNATNLPTSAPRSRRHRLENSGDLQQLSILLYFAWV